MDILRQNGNKKRLIIIFYCFLIPASLQTLALLHYLVSDIVFELIKDTSHIILCTIFCIPLEWLMILIAVLYYSITKRKSIIFCYMLIINFSLILITVIFLFCAPHDFSNRKKQELMKKCQQKEIINNLTFCFSGFSSDEVNKIPVRQIHDGKIVDIFYISPTVSQTDTTLFYASIDTVYISDIYQFLFSNITFTINEIKIGLKLQYTMTSIHCKCDIESYRINDSIFQKHGYIELKNITNNQVVEK
jgi:hypothetical protein